MKQQSIMDEPRVIFGYFKDNELTDYNTGEIISCATYLPIRKEIQDKEGFFHLKKNEWGDWIIFQYVDI